MNANLKVLVEGYDPRFMMHDSEISFTRDAIRCIKEERKVIKELEERLVALIEKNRANKPYP